MAYRQPPKGIITDLVIDSTGLKVFGEDEWKVRNLGTEKWRVWCKLHLAVEDKALYPALQRSGDATLARLGQQFQDDMGPIAQAFDGFARRWNTAERLRSDPQGFRNDANTVLKRVYERMQRENREFYPRIEEAQTNAVA
mgnify:CR=1 FL=1